MLRVVVTGAAGKMGKSNIKVIQEDKESQLVGAIEYKGSPAVGQDAGLIAGCGPLNVLITDDLKAAISETDVIIDFSSAGAAESNIRLAVQYSKALVIGTTGLNDSIFSLIKEAGKKIPIICAPNYSVGVSLIASLTAIAAKILDKGFDAEIVEIHHNMKKDSPSGTAIKLLNVLKEAYKTDDVVYGREGMVGARPEKQIGVSAVRGGDIVGDHTVYFFGQGERVEITHKASSRETFSRGALRAAKYIISKGPGVYSMEEVLGLK